MICLVRNLDNCSSYLATSTVIEFLNLSDVQKRSICKVVSQQDKVSNGNRSFVAPLSSSIMKFLVICFFAGYRHISG